MKEMLYIRHAYHSKTKSNDFLIDILKKHYNITIFDIDPYTEDLKTTLKNLPKKDFDVLVLFQLPIAGTILKKYINFKKGIFFPMYDGAPQRTDKIWLSWKSFNIINFSRTLHLELTKIGLSSFYVQYFPTPKLNVLNGEKNSAFFWQRLTHLNVNTIADILKALSIKNIHIHKVVDPMHNFIKPTDETFNIEYSEWYENKNNMLKDVENAAIYIAPRDFEGIGMSFLEAMAMGRCVIAPNNPTMNEYITNGFNGILYELDNPKINKKYNIKSIQENTKKYIQQGYLKWSEEKNKILDYINLPVQTNNKLLKQFKYQNYSFLQQIFSIKNEYSNKKIKIITFLGIKVKIKSNI